MPINESTQKKISEYIKYLSIHCPTATTITRTIFLLSNDSLDIEGYLYHTNAAILHLKSIETGCQDAKRLCHTERRWWGLSKMLSAQIEYLNLHELNAEKIRKDFEYKFAVARKKLDEKKRKELQMNPCVCKQKLDSLSGPINGDLQQVHVFQYLMMHDPLTKEEAIGTAPRYDIEMIKNLAREGGV